MSASGKWMEGNMKKALRGRRAKGTLRSLPNASDDAKSDQEEVLDFSTNDYLGLASDPAQKRLVEARLKKDQVEKPHLLGATGSRLLSGDSVGFHSLEGYLARVHHRESALLCNSGYDANLAVISSLSCDCVLYDEYIHNSLHMGLRLWHSQQPEIKQSAPFQHNNVEDLLRKLDHYRGRNIVVLVESVYSMDGDVAPLKDVLDCLSAFGAQLVVDEAHGLGVYGRHSKDGYAGTGVLAADGLEGHPALACSVHTFGKAAGCHGAVVCGSAVLKEYLINYGYPIIYSTALPAHSLVTIRCAYETMVGQKGDLLRATVFERVYRFRQLLTQSLAGKQVSLLPSTSPIQALLIPGNDACTKFCARVFARSRGRIKVFPIKWPTVPRGQERVRIILHASNTSLEVKNLVETIMSALSEMGLEAPVMAKL